MNGAGLAERSIAAQVLTFGRLLRRLGLDVTLNRTIDAVRSLDFVDVFNREDFYLALRANLASRQEDLAVFDRAFDLFWRSPPDEASAEEMLQDEDCCSGDEPGGSDGDEVSDQRIVERLVEEWLEQGDADVEDVIAGYSPMEILAAKDFSTYSDEEVKALRRLLAQLAPKIATRLSRRSRADCRGRDFDPRRTLRANLKYAGDIVELPRKRRKVAKTKIVLLCDVSGSMDCYSRFLIQFVYTLQNQLRGVETFVFSTRLNRITTALRTRDIHEALARLPSPDLDWSGGTKIGSCLYTFNTTVASTVLSKRSVVVIISDGWDQGDSDLLAAEMRRLRSRCHKIIWLNPLAGHPGYQAICKGMSAALPFVDYFMPAHNLNALIELTRVLRSVSKQ